MKKLNLFVVLTFFIVSIQAQDTIKFVNGNLLAAKILEINTTTIKYKPLNNMDGPDYIDEKNRISWIKYANGMVDTIKAVQQIIQPAQEFPTLKALAPQYNKIAMLADKYFFLNANNQINPKRIGINRILKNANAMANEKKIQPLTDLVKKTNTNKKLQTVFGIVGAPVTLIGFAAALTGLAISSSAYTPSEQSDGDDLALVGATITTIGIGFEIISIVNGNLKKKRLKQTIDLYNQNL